MKKYGCTWAYVTHNPVIALLLVCKAMHSATMERLYEDKTFVFGPALEFVLEIPVNISQI